mgnify:CR=1 FL=1
MKKIIFFIFMIFTVINSNGFANSKDCKEFKKFSVEYFKCKGKLIKDKTISSGKNIIKDTKDYQKDEWLEEKDKINKTKEKILN